MKRLGGYNETIRLLHILFVNYTSKNVHRVWCPDIYQTRHKKKNNMFVNTVSKILNRNLS